MNEADDIYKVITLANGQLEVNLNRLARDGWRVIHSHFDPMAKGSNQWHVLLERLPEKRR